MTSIGIIIYNRVTGNDQHSAAARFFIFFFCNLRFDVLHLLEMRALRWRWWWCNYNRNARITRLRIGFQIPTHLSLSLSLLHGGCSGSDRYTATHRQKKKKKKSPRTIAAASFVTTSNSVCVCVRGASNRCSFCLLQGRRKRRRRRRCNIGRESTVKWGCAVFTGETKKKKKKKN